MLTAGLFAAVVAAPNREVAPVAPVVLLEVFPNKLVGLLAVVVSFGVFPKPFAAKPPNEPVPEAGGFPKRLVVLPVFKGFTEFVVVAGAVVFNGFTVAPVFNGFGLLFKVLVVVAPSIPAVFVLPVRPLLFELLNPPKSEGFELLLLDGAPRFNPPVLTVYLFALFGAPWPNRFPVAAGGWDRAVLLLFPNIEVGFAGVEVADRGFPKLVAPPPPNKPAVELLLAAGGLLPLLPPKRLLAPVEFPGVPKRLVPGTELLFIPSLYENYKI